MCDNELCRYVDVDLHLTNLWSISCFDTVGWVI